MVEGSGGGGAGQSRRGEAMGVGEAWGASPLAALRFPQPCHGSWSLASRHREPAMQTRVPTAERSCFQAGTF